MPNSSKNRVKLLDIAQASGVSLTAVSLALSDKPGISQETRIRVMEVARSLGYRFKAPVSTTPNKTIRTVGLLVKSGVDDEPHANHFYSHIISGIESTCRQMNINLMFANLPVDDLNYPLEIPPLVNRGDVDGILLAGAFVDENLSRVLSSRSIPLVLIDSYSSVRPYNSILSDNILGTYQAVEYLIHKGHRHIAFVGSNDQSFPSFRERRQGYRNALSDYGLGQPLFVNVSTYSRTEIGAAVVSFYRQHPEVTALVGVNDETIINAMRALMEAGVRIPQDVSMIGFDDIYLAERVMPALTTMHVNKFSMGKLAVQILLNQAYQFDSGHITSIFRPSLVERSSVMALTPASKSEEDRTSYLSTPVPGREAKSQVHQVK